MTSLFRRFTLVALLLSLLGLSSTQPIKVSAQTVTQKTVVLYVNGINTPLEDVKNNDLTTLKARWLDYATSKGIATRPIFDYSYNKHTTFWGDLGQAISEATGLSLSYLKSETSVDNGIIWAVMTWGYGDEAIKFRHKVHSDKNDPDPDLVALNEKVRCYLQGGTVVVDQITNVLTACQNPGTKWSGTKVVLLGHSQGSFYTNFAYEDLLNDRNFQNQLGITLPDANVLEVVNWAVPANYAADGRYQYLTVCNDPIQLVPQSLPQNEKSGVASVICGWDVQAFKAISPLAAGLMHKAMDVAMSEDGSSSHEASPESKSLLANAWKAILNVAGDVINFTLVSPHFLDNYLKQGSTQLQSAMRLLQNAFHDPGCSGAIDCYMVDDFIGSDYTRNWVKTSDSDFRSNLKQDGGILELDTRNEYFAGNGPIITIDYAPRTTVHTRRVLNGSFSAVVSINANGYGVSSVNLRRVKGNSLVLALSVNPELGVYPSTGYHWSGDFTGWHKIEFAKSGTILKLYTYQADGQRIEQASTTSTEDVESYYLEFDSANNKNANGVNTLQIRNLSISRLTILDPSQPPSAPSGYSGKCWNTPGSGSYPTIPTTAADLSRTYAKIDFDWGGSSPDSKINVDHFVCRWTKNDVFENAIYKFEVSADDGVRVYVDNVLIIDHWVDQPWATYTVSKTMTGGSHEVKVEYYENGGVAAARFSYTNTGSVTPPPLVPTISKLAVFSPVADTPFEGLIEATNIVSSQIQVWAFGANGCHSGCQHRDNGVEVTRDGLTLHDVQLAAGDFYFKLRNTDHGAWSNASTTFTVAPPPPTPATGTINIIVSGYSSTVNCNLNGVGINPPTTLTGQVSNSYTVSCAAPSGYTLTISPTIQTLSPGGTINFSVVLTPIVTTGTINITVSGYSGSVTCVLDGPLFNAPTTLYNQPTGNKTLSCANPVGYNIASTTPSATQTLSAGGSITFAMTLAPVAPTITLLTPNHTPKKSQNFDLTVDGAGFVATAQGHVCDGTSSSSKCFAVQTNFVNSGQLTLPAVNWQATGTIWIKVIQNGLTSNFMSLTVNP